MPIFYANAEPLNPTRHAGVGLLAKPGFGFARRAHAIPIMAAEMPSAMRSYPIVFAGPRKMPVVITGIRKDQNLFVEEDGNWSQPHYVPAYVRRYPFVLAGAEDSERLTLCIERDPERVVTLDGKGGPATLFDGEEPSETTRKALEFCQNYQSMFNTTWEIVKRIEEKKLFVTRLGRVTLDTGEVLSITDFDVIDEAAFNALSDEDFLSLRRNGALAVIYCHLASTNSWSSLLHQAKQRGLQPATGNT